MRRAGLQFSLLSIVLLTLAMGIIFALCFNLPPGQFAFESFASAYAPLSLRAVARRMLIVSPLVAMESVGIFLVVMNYKHRPKG